MDAHETLRRIRGRWLASSLLGLLAFAALISAAPASASPEAAGSPPATVGSVDVSRSDGKLRASWDAPSGATHYHVTYSDNGKQSWQLAALDHTETSIRIDVDNAKTYIVGVRAKNEHGGSGWTNSAAAGPYTPPPPPSPPGAVAAVSISRADGTLTASWDAPAGATSYHVTYTDNGAASWQLAALDHAATSIVINADNAKTYIVGVRAKNAGGGSNWTNSASAGPFTPPPPPERGIIVQDADGNPITALSVPEGGEASYQVKLLSQPDEDVEVCIGLSVRDNNDPDITFKGEAADAAALKLTFTPQNWNTAQTVTLVAAEDDDYTNGARDVTHDARDWYGGKVDWTASEIDNDELTAPTRPSGLSARAGDERVILTWDDPADASISRYEYRLRYAGVAWSDWTAMPLSGAGTTSFRVEGLTNDTEYRFKIRAVNSAGESRPAPAAAPWYVAATPEAAPTLTVENESASGADLTLGNYDGTWYYRADGPPGAAGAGGASGASGASGQSGCVGPINGEQTTVGGLDADTRYTINVYGTGCGGAAIASGQLVTAAGSGTLTASNVAYYGATLTITGHSSNWYYKQTAPSSGDCTLVYWPGNTASLTRLEPGTSYTFKAYSNAACNTEVTSDATDAEFTTSSVVLSTPWHIVPEGSSETHTVWLSHRPSANVTVTITTTGDSDISANPTTLTFTPSNWSNPQTVTLTAAQDNDTVPGAGKGDGDYAYGATTVTHTATSTDANFNNVSSVLDATEGDDDVCAGTTAVGGSTVTSGPIVEDCDTLLAAKDIIKVSDSVLDNWNTGTAMSSWTGVKVENSRVTELNVTFYWYSSTGNVPNTVADLDALTKLVVESGVLASRPGPMPRGLASLTGLSVLRLYNRELTGQLPANIGNLTELTELALDNSQLSGPLPASLANLTNLTRLWLNNNRFSGQIPNQLGGLTTMTSSNFALGENRLSGCVPAGWSKYLSVINPQHDASGNDVTLPLCVGKPDKPTVASVNEGAALSWTAPSGGTPTSYEVQWRPCTVTYGTGCQWRTENGPWQSAWPSWDAGPVLDGLSTGQITATGSPATVSGLRNGVRYQLRVRGLNSSGPGPWSEPSDDVFPNRRPPGVPTAVGASQSISGAAVVTTVDWTRPANESGAIGYSIQCSSDNGATYSATACATVTATTNANLRATHSYSGPSSTKPNKVRVRAEQHGHSAWVESAIGSDPRNLSVSYGSTGITISWSKPSGVSPSTSYAYHADSSADGTTWTRQKTESGSSAASVSHTVTSGVIAKARVRTIDSSGTASAWFEATLNSPTNIGSQIQGTTLKLRWDRPSGASGANAYAVECNDSASGGTWTSCTTVAATSDSTVTASVSNKGSVKRVRVRVTAGSASGPWATASVPAGVPTAPGSLSAAINHGGVSSWVTIDWNKPSSAQSSDSLSYEATCSSDNGVTWTYCGTNTVAATTNQTLSVNIGDKTAITNARVVAFWDGLRSPTASWAKTPGAPGDVGAQVQGTTLKLRWDRPSVASGALSYTVGCNNSASGGTWDDTCHTVSASSNASFSASVTNKGSVQRVRVKATQSSVDGAWTTVSVPSGVPGAISALGAQLPDGGTTLKLRWDKPSGATVALDYAVECNNSASGGTWTSCHTVSASSNASFTASLSGQGSVKRVRVRAERDGLQGAWTSGAVPSGLPAAPSSLSLTKQGTTSKATVGKPSSVTGAVTYRVHCSTDNGATWTACNVTSSSSDASHELLLPSSATNANAVRARVERDGLVSVWLRHPAKLTASAVTDTTATLTLEGHTAAWYYKATSGPHTTCQGPVAAGTFSKGLTGLSGNATYTYSAYSDSGCTTGKLLATASQFTTQVSVSNLSETFSSSSYIGNNGSIHANRFRAGGNSGGYTLSSVTVDINGRDGNPGTLQVEVWSDSSGSPGSKVAGLTLNGTDPPASGGQATYTCSGSCTLTANDYYWIRLSASGGNGHRWRWSRTTSASETLEPSGNGWQIGGRKLHVFGNTWVSKSDYHKFKVTAAPKPSLTASSITTTTATLTIANHSGNWYYKADTGPDSTCQGPAHSGSVTLAGLTTNTTYTYTAYNDSACANTLATAAAFTTLQLTAGSIADTSATLTIANHAGTWYYQADVAPDTACTGPVSTTSKALTGLTPSTTYTYKAYQASGCASADLLATASAFTTLASPTLTVTSDTSTTATLTIANHTGNWYFQADVAPHAAACHPAGSTATKSVTSLTAGTTYIYKAYSDAACTTLLATASAVTTPSLTASAVTNTTATLTLAERTGSWWLKQTAPTPAGTCTAGEADFSHALSNLSASTGYTFEAYSDSTCSAKIASETFTTLATLTASAIADTTATLSIADHSGNWYVKKISPSPAGSCSSVISSGSSHNLSTLTASTAYTYEAYSDSGCTAKIASETFTTLASSLSASSIGPTSATLTIGNHTGNWYVKQTTPTGGTCSASAITGTTHDVSSLSSVTAHVFHAYSDSSCTTAVARAAFITNPHPPTNVTHSTTGGGCTVFSPCTLTVSWERNSSASGSIGYHVWTKSNLPNNSYQLWKTQGPTTNANLGLSGSTWKAHYARVRAYKSVNGTTVYSDWIYSSNNP